MNPLNVFWLIPSIKASSLATSLISLDTTLAGSIIPATLKHLDKLLCRYICVAGIIGEANNSKSGLMPSEYTIYSEGSKALDFNTCKNIGRMYSSYGSINGPIGGAYYWGIFNIGYAGGWFVQIACASYTDGKMRMYRRIHYSNNSWTAWELF